MEKQTEELLLDVLTKFSNRLDRDKKLQRWFLIIWLPLVGIFFTVMIGCIAFDLLKDARANEEEKAWEASPENWTRNDMWGDVNQGDFEAAVQKANHLLSKNPDDPFFNNDIGDLYACFCKYAEAKQYYQKAYDLWPSEAHKCSLDTVNVKLGLTQ